ncbi:hypothetical protein Tsubulata_043424 [Turnera subulata]|uniref:Cleavage stimulation factor 50 kDa subunit n=1 Tax=Turnera subulata TaxID=218843 RepID=A0A9Q0GCZ7_9ROSI|nr:hypothetical protein Tsubulata_043424 [Turnera subulata]
MENSSLEQTLQDGKLHRQVNCLIVAHLRDTNLTQAASAVASATMIPLNVEAPPNRLLELVAKGLAVEKDETLRGVSSTALYDSGSLVSAAYGAIPAPRTASVDFGAVQDSKGLSKSFPKHETRHLSEHKNIARCARFSPDGRFVATGSADTSIKLFEVAKIKQMMLPDQRDGPVRPVIRTFYDHIQVRYSSTGGMYVTASKDGAVRLWDGVSANCIRSIDGAHGTAEATSASFTKDQRFVLSCGKDSSVKLWEVGSGKLVKQYTGATHTQLRCQAVFNDTEEFVLSVDEASNEIAIWDALTAEKVAKWPSNHIGAPRWLEHSPTEAAFISCGTDRSVRFWKENL